MTEAYRVGGAQAVAALAYGTETIRRVDKIVGPGNLYVALAKSRVFGDVGIDMVAHSAKRFGEVCQLSRKDFYDIFPDGEEHSKRASRIARQR